MAPRRRDDDGPSWYVDDDDSDENRFLDENGQLALHLVPYRDSVGGEGYRPCEDATGLLVSPKDRRLAKLGLLVVNVRGEFYNQAGTTAGDYGPGRPIQLIPEPDNPHDDRAVMVCDGSGGNKCGYMNKQQARRYLKRLEAGEQLEGMVLFHRIVDGEREAVQIIVGSPDQIATVRSPRPAGAVTPAHMR